LLVCGLANAAGPDVGSLTPYFQHTLRYCGQKFAAAGMDISTAWLSNHVFDGTPAELDELLGAYNGFVFVGCVPEHPLFAAVQARGLNHVTLGRTFPGPGHVWFDPAQALELALADVPMETTPVFVVASTTSTQVANALQQWQDRGLVPLTMPHPTGQPGWQWETPAYQVVRGVCGSFTDAAYIFLDDILARGGTRALLEAGIRPAHSAVVCGRQEIFPYGLPVTYITHDTEQEAQWAVDMLAAQMNNGGSAADDSRQSPYERTQTPADLVRTETATAMAVNA